MKRRTFLKVSGGSTLAGIASSRATVSSFSKTRREVAQASPKVAHPVIAVYAAADQRRRLENVAICNRGIRNCLRKHLITDYLPGQCSYNLGEYPCRKPWDPDEWDEHELDKLRDEGIGLIQVQEEWNDSQRLFGADKLSPLNPAGFRRFVEMVHRRGMKLIVYASTGFFERRDPDFRPEWARSPDIEWLCCDYAWCSPASPGWRAYLLPRLTKILDDYGVDGIYDDLGYESLYTPGVKPSRDEVAAFEESAHHDGALEDLLGLVYAEVKRRGGIVKVHYGAALCPQTNMKIYDYLWVGEGVRDGDSFRKAVKNYVPYVIPCLDMSRATVANEDELYLHSIPYMQFPVLLAGRPFTGERALIPGIRYQPEEKDFWIPHCRAIWKYYQEHPQGPYSYGWWDSVPGRPESRPTHTRWLKRYLPMVEEGTWAWIEVRDSNLFKRACPPAVVASVFANLELYLVLANYGHQAAEIETVDAFSLADGASEARKQWKLEARSLYILQRSVRS